MWVVGSFVVHCNMHGSLVIASRTGLESRARVGKSPVRKTEIYEL